MSKISKIKNVSLTSQSVDLDFNSLESNGLNYTCYPKKTLNYIGEKYVIERLFFVDNSLYLYGDRKLSFVEGKRVILIDDKTFYYEPRMVSIKNNNEESHLIFDDEVAKFTVDGKSFPFMGGESYVVVSDMLFNGYFNELYVMKDFNVDDEKQEYSHGFNFKVERKDGNIFGLAEYDEGILILCKHKILKLSITKDPGDIVIEKVLTPYFTAKGNSFRTCGDKAVFVAEEGLCIYDRGKLTIVKLPNGVSYISSYNNCSNNGSLYVIPFKKNNEPYLLVYDLSEKTFTEIKSAATALSRNGAYFVGEDRYVYQIVKGSITTGGSDDFDSITTHLNTCNDKLLSSIEVHAIGSATLSVLFDGGEKTFAVNEGCNKLRCNLCSKQFTFTFKDKSQTFKVEKVKVNYTKLGG